MIEAFYSFAGIPVATNLKLNNSVAAIFGVMLQETHNCSKTFKLIPPPPSGRATISWLAKAIGKALIKSLNNETSTSGAKAVIAKWNQTLRIASELDISIGLPQWR
ncbi:MAG: hypothetical protein OEZ58_18970 [Gammaproteobacteria bacterium]|nr:hypothetical protein [Gammaproteobacteria bacterium]MDH5731070.1 hypothetical protein [Gammaproteobacteria bacterium]